MRGPAAEAPALGGSQRPPLTARLPHTFPARPCGVSRGEGAGAAPGPTPPRPPRPSLGAAAAQFAALSGTSLSPPGFGRRVDPSHPGQPPSHPRPTAAGPAALTVEGCARGTLRLTFAPAALRSAEAWPSLRGPLAPSGLHPSVEAQPPFAEHLRCPPPFGVRTSAVGPQAQVGGEALSCSHVHAATCKGHVRLWETRRQVRESRWPRGRTSTCTWRCRRLAPAVGGAARDSPGAAGWPPSKR